MKELEPHIIECYLSGQASESECSRVDEWYQAQDAQPAITPQLSIEQKARVAGKMFAAIEQEIALRESQPCSL